MNMYPSKVYLNGQIVDHEDAKISVFDRGFLFGDGIYEVIPQINGSFFHGEAHFERLSECLKKIKIEFNVERIKEQIEDLLSTSKLVGQDCLLYIQVTRGIAPRKHAFPIKKEPTVMMYALRHKFPEINESKLSVITQEDIRWHRCDIKSISFLPNIMANENAVSHGHYETLFIRNGKITEASHCNVFFVKDQVVYTHPANQEILNGITRQIVIKLCKDLKLSLKEEAISEEDIPHMDEAFLTGTSTQIASIKKIDDHYFYTGDMPGTITSKLQKAFLNLKNRTN